MKKRKPAARGLSYVDANRNRVVTIEDDVLRIKSRIMDRWPELDVYWDTEQEEFIVVETRKDGIEQFVCAVPTLNEELIRRLEAADTHVRGQEDPLALIDAYNEAVERETDRKFEEQIGDAGERLAFALRKDGISHAPRVFIPNRERLST